LIPEGADERFYVHEYDGEKWQWSAEEAARRQAAKNERQRSASMNEVRIRGNLELQKLYEWPNPPAPKPLKPRAKVFEDEYEKLVKNKRAWALRCIWNGL
jgi:hypothetical protein